MKLSYRLATISYCPDLTDPDAVSLPIAVLAVGKDEGHWSAAAVGLDAKRMGLDPLSSAMLSDVPHMIRRHIDSGMKLLEATASPDAVLRAFHESLKTSIHVSAISEPGQVEVPNPRRIAAALIELSLDVLERAIRNLSEASRVGPERLMDPAPEQLFWQPPSPTLHAVAG